MLSRLCHRRFGWRCCCRRSRADRGTVDIRNNGSVSLVQLANANVSGDVAKAGALGTNGQLFIGGGTIHADTSLKLYGDASGTEGSGDACGAAEECFGPESSYGSKRTTPGLPEPLKLHAQNVFADGSPLASSKPAARPAHIFRLG